MKLFGICAALAVSGIAFAQTDKRAEEQKARDAIKLFQKSYASPDETMRAQAVGNLAQFHHELVVQQLAPILTSDTNPVRIAVAQGLAGIECLESVKALAGAVEPNIKETKVLEEISKALQKLDWEAGAAVLNPLLEKYTNDDILAALDTIIPVLGKIGSPTSVDLLVDLLEDTELPVGGARRAGKLKGRGAGNKYGKEISKLKKPVSTALSDITGWKESDSQAWRKKWEAEGRELLTNPTIVYFCRNTGKKWEQKKSEKIKCPYDEKTTTCILVAKTKLH